MSSDSSPETPRDISDMSYSSVTSTESASPTETLCKTEPFEYVMRSDIDADRYPAHTHPLPETQPSSELCNPPSHSQPIAGSPFFPTPNLPVLQPEAVSPLLHTPAAHGSANPQLYGAYAYEMSHRAIHAPPRPHSISLRQHRMQQYGYAPVHAQDHAQNHVQYHAQNHVQYHVHHNTQHPQQYALYAQQHPQAHAQQIHAQQFQQMQHAQSHVQHPQYIQPAQPIQPNFIHQDMSSSQRHYGRTLPQGSYQGQLPQAASMRETCIVPVNNEPTPMSPQASTTNAPQIVRSPVSVKSEEPEWPIAIQQLRCSYHRGENSIIVSAPGLRSSIIVSGLPWHRSIRGRGLPTDEGGRPFASRPDATERILGLVESPDYNCRSYNLRQGFFRFAGTTPFDSENHPTAGDVVQWAVNCILYEMRYEKIPNTDDYMFPLYHTRELDKPITREMACLTIVEFASVRVFLCPFCSVSFRRSADARRHIMCHATNNTLVLQSNHSRGKFINTLVDTHFMDPNSCTKDILGSTRHALPDSARLMYGPGPEQGTLDMRGSFAPDGLVHPEAKPEMNFEFFKGESSIDEGPLKSIDNMQPQAQWTGHMAEASFI